MYKLILNVLMILYGFMVLCIAIKARILDHELFLYKLILKVHTLLVSLRKYNLFPLEKIKYQRCR